MTIPLNTWTHLAATRSSSGSNNVKIYVNGVLNNQVTSSVGLTASTSDFGIGKRMGGNTFPFAGRVDEVRLWSTVRTATQIANYMNTTYQSAQTNLIASYSFSEGSGSTTTNHAGSYGNGTLYSTTWYVSAPPAPTANAASSISTSGFIANWTAVSGATSYRLDVSTSSTFSSFVSGYNNLTVSGDNRIVSSLSAGMTYYYRVRAVNSGGTSANSSTITLSTVPPAPTANSATAVSASGFTANWTSSSGATSYRLDVSTNSAFSSFISGYQNLDVGSNTYKVIGSLSANATYYYRVRAANTGGISANSGSASATTLPLAASYSFPADEASLVDNPPSLSWQPPAGGATGYRVYLGTDNPPTNVINGYLQASNSITPSSLAYNTLYYWKIVPYNGSGNAANPEIWSFTTTDLYNNTAPQVVVGETTIEPQIEIPSISGEFSPMLNTGWNPPDSPYENVGLQIIIGGVNMNGRLVIIDPDQGFIPSGLAWQILPATDWNYVPAEDDWRADYTYFTVNSGKADGDLVIVFPESGDITLPVELSSFTAMYYYQSNYVLLKWVTQTETDHLGYNVLRSESGSLQSALRLNSSLITDGQSLGTQVSYQYHDHEVDFNSSYQYWLESIALNGNPQYFGPILLNSVLPDQDIPNVPFSTMLIGAYPNPFNPSTTISFALETPQRVCIDIYNARGQKVQHFEQDYILPGTYCIIFDGRDDNQKSLSSGVYYYRMTAGKYSETRKMILSK